MNETLVTMIGNVASTVSYGQTPAGVPIANFRLAATERRYDRSRGDWVDGDTNWVTVVAWRWLAANVVSSLSKGDPVVVSGRLRVREWDDGGRRRTGVEIDARVVGHDLGRGTSAFRRAVQGRPELVAARPGARAVEPGGAAQGVAQGVMGAESAAALGERRFGNEASARGRAAPVGEAVPEWIVEAIRAHEASGVARAAGVVGQGEVKAPGEVDRAGGGGEVAVARAVRRARRGAGDPGEGEGLPERPVRAVKGAVSRESRTAEKSTGKPTEKPAERPVEKPVEKPVDESAVITV